MVTSNPTPLTRALSEALRVEAARQRMTQSDLARASGVTQSTISRIFADKRDRITIDDLSAMCDALGLDLAKTLEDAREYVHTNSTAMPA